MSTEQSREARLEEIVDNPNQTEDEKAEGLAILTELYNSL